MYIPNSRKLRSFFIEYKRNLLLLFLAIIIIIMQANSECETGDSGSYCFCYFPLVCENKEKKQREEISSMEMNVCIGSVNFYIHTDDGDGERF